MSGAAITAGTSSASWCRPRYWPHPLTWPLGRLLGAAREQACDDLCVHILGGAAGYRAASLAVAAGLDPPPRPPRSAWRWRGPRTSPAAWPGSTGRPGAPGLPAPLGPLVAPWLLAVAALAGLLGSIELAHAQAPAPSKAEATPKADPPSHRTHAGQTRSAQPATPSDAIEVEVRAQDTGQPLAGATVRVLRWTMLRVVRQADSAKGRLRLDLSRATVPGLAHLRRLGRRVIVQQRYCLLPSTTLDSPGFPGKSPSNYGRVKKPLAAR